MEGQPSRQRGKWGAHLGTILFLAAIVGPLAYIYGKGNHEDALRTCIRRGPPDSTAKTPLQQAQQMGACVDKTSNLIGRQFFAPTHDMLASLPNAPSQWQGVWIGDEYGNPHEFHLCADSRIRVRQAEDPTADDAWRGSWGVYEDQMLWFRNDRGPVLPAQSLKMSQPAPGQMDLKDSQGQTRRFERSSETPRCNQTGP